MQIRAEPPNNSKINEDKYMQSRKKLIDLKGWTIVNDGSEFRFYNKNVKLCHRDKFPWLIGEFKISLSGGQKDRATFFVNRMVSEAFPKIYLADKKYLEKKNIGINHVKQYQNESSNLFFTSPFSHDYAKGELYKLGCSQHADMFFMSSAELGLYAHARCNDFGSYAAFAKDGLTILAQVEPSLNEAISIIELEINNLTIENPTLLNTRK